MVEPYRTNEPKKRFSGGRQKEGPRSAKESSTFQGSQPCRTTDEYGAVGGGTSAASAVLQGLISAPRSVSSSGHTGKQERSLGERAVMAWEGQARGVTSLGCVRNVSGSGSGSVRRLSHRLDELQRLRRGPRGGASLRRLGPGPCTRGLGPRRAARRHRCGE